MFSQQLKLLLLHKVLQQLPIQSQCKECLLLMVDMLHTCHQCQPHSILMQLCLVLACLIHKHLLFHKRLYQVGVDYLTSRSSSSFFRKKKNHFQEHSTTELIQELTLIKCNRVAILIHRIHRIQISHLDFNQHHQAIIIDLLKFKRNNQTMFLEC